MSQISAWIRKRPIVSFYVITFAITWGLGFSYIALIKNELFMLAPLFSVATCGPALAGIFVTTVADGRTRLKLGRKLARNRARWIAFFIAQIACTAIFVAHNHLFNDAPLTPVMALFAFFLLTPPVAFIVSAAYSRGTAVRAMMGSLVRLRDVVGWALLALVLVPGIALLSVAASDFLGRQPASAARNEVLGAPLLGLIAIKFLYQSKGSILVAGTAHAAANTIFVFLPNLDWILYSAMMVIVALLLILFDRMWKRLPQEDPAVSHAPGLAE